VRRFTLRRGSDVSGVSGTGAVAQGVESDSGVVVLFWLTSPRSIAIYDSALDLVAIHGHGGATTIEWQDPPLAALLARRAQELGRTAPIVDERHNTRGKRGDRRK